MGLGGKDPFEQKGVRLGGLRSPEEPARSNSDCPIRRTHA